MAERNERNERAPERRKAEGVRIIGAEEAQKALDAGHAAGRRSDDELRYGDVPPAPSGPRPPHRFPLPDSVDPAVAVPRSPVAPIKAEPTVVRGRHGAAGTARGPATGGAGATEAGEAEAVAGEAEAVAGEPDGADEGSAVGDSTAPDSGPPESVAPESVAPGFAAQGAANGGPDAPPAGDQTQGSGRPEPLGPGVVGGDGVPASEPQLGSTGSEWAPGTLDARSAQGPGESGDLEGGRPEGDEPTGEMPAAGVQPEPTPAATGGRRRWSRSRRVGKEPSAWNTAEPEPSDGLQGDDDDRDRPVGDFESGPTPASPDGPPSDPAPARPFPREPVSEDRAGWTPPVAPRDEASPWSTPVGEQVGPGQPGTQDPTAYEPAPGALSSPDPAIDQPGPGPAASRPPDGAIYRPGPGWAASRPPDAATYQPGPEGEEAAEPWRVASDEPPGFAAAPDEPPGFAAAADEPPGFAAAADEPPGFAAAPDEPPGFAAAADEPPGFAAAADEPPGFAAAADEPPGFAAAPDEPPGYPVASGYEQGSGAAPDPSDASPAPTPSPSAGDAPDAIEAERRTPFAGRVPGSRGQDPYAWRGMADQPEDEPTTASPWIPPAEGQDRAWNLGERGGEAPRPLPAEEAGSDLAPPEEGITLTGSHQLPHWSEPASGEVPAALADPAAGDDYEAWEALGSSKARWRSEHDNWDDASDAHYLEGDEERGGALDSDIGDRSDLYSFDEDFERLEEERSGTHRAVPFDDEVVALDDGEEEPAQEERRVAIGTRVIPRRRTPAARGSKTQRRVAPSATDGASSTRGDLGGRLAVGAGLLVLLVVAGLLGSKGLLVLAAIVIVACAVEAYGILQRSGFRPATLLGLVATAGFMFAGYWRGVGALPLVLGLTFAATMVWYLLGIVEARPLANVAVTSMTVVWVGLFGSFASLLLRAGDGRGLFIGVVVVTVVSDIVAYLVGKQFGRRALAPDISPGKTVEGLVAGIVAALVVGAIVGKEIAPWGGLIHGLVLGVVVAILAPIGDLFESLIKRDLNVKDSGTILGAHGGVLDRFDSLLLVLPGAYFFASYLHILR